MSIAWSTVVLVVLLIPGFALLWGFYAPNQVTRESVPASPLGQLAAVVIASFACHGLFYAVINGVTCSSGWTPCVRFEELAALLRADLTPSQTNPQPVARVGPMLDSFGVWILVYFMVASAVTGCIGYLSAKLVERGALPITRHRYLFMLEEGRRQRDSAAESHRTGAVSKLVRAHILSKTLHDDNVLIYDGILQDFFAKSDGTISYVVLRGAQSGCLQIASGTQQVGTRIPLDRTNANSNSALFVITSEDIANVYFEPLVEVTQTPDEAKVLEERLRKLELKSKVGTEDAG